MRHVIVFGPAGCGKTRNAEALQEHFACKAVVDEASNLRQLPTATVSTLYLTNEADLRVKGPHIRVDWRELFSYGFRFEDPRS